MFRDTNYHITCVFAIVFVMVHPCAHHSTGVVFIRCSEPGVWSTLTWCHHILTLKRSSSYFKQRTPTEGMQPLVDAMLVKTLETATGGFSTAFAWVRALQMGLLWADLHGCDDVWCIMQTLVFLPFLAVFQMCGFVLHLLFQDFLTIAIHQILKTCVCMCGPPCPSTMHHANCVCCQSHQWPIKHLSGQLQHVAAVWGGIPKHVWLQSGTWDLARKMITWY